MLVFGSTQNLSCFQYRPEKRLYIWPFIEKTHLRPENQAYLWPSPAQSRRSEPFGVARAACFEQLAGVFASCGAMHHTNIFMNYSHDVNRLPVSLTSDANFVVNEFFSVTVVNEMQVLLTTHKSTNFSNLLFPLNRLSEKVDKA